MSSDSFQTDEPAADSWSVLYRTTWTWCVFLLNEVFVKKKKKKKVSTMLFEWFIVNDVNLYLLFCICILKLICQIGFRNTFE